MVKPKGNKSKKSKKSKSVRDKEKQQQVESHNAQINNESSEKYAIKGTVSQPTLVDDVDFMTSRDFCVDSNAHLQTLQEQVKDTKTIAFFKRCILENEHLYRGKTVLVLRCQIGLLALFAAKAGAASVYAMDYSNAVDYARRVVAAQTNYKDIIQLYKGRVADTELPVAQVDIIICNWMGHALLHDSECVELIKARDKWLKPNGLIVPDIARMYITTINNSEGHYNRSDWWMNVYNFNLKIMGACALSEPACTSVDPSHLTSLSHCVHTIDMHKATVESLCFRSTFPLEITKPGYLTGVALHFDVEFTHAHVPFKLSTGPKERYATQWLQTVFITNEIIMLAHQHKHYAGVEMTSKAVVQADGNDDGNAVDLSNLEFSLEIYDSGDGFEDTDEFYNLLLRQRWQLRTNWCDLKPSIVEQNKNCLYD